MSFSVQIYKLHIFKAHRKVYDVIQLFVTLKKPKYCSNTLRTAAPRNFRCDKNMSRMAGQGHSNTWPLLINCRSARGSLFSLTVRRCQGEAREVIYARTINHLPLTNDPSAGIVTISAIKHFYLTMNSPMRRSQSRRGRSIRFTLGLVMSALKLLSLLRTTRMTMGRFTTRAVRAFMRRKDEEKMRNR